MHEKKVLDNIYLAPQTAFLTYFFRRVLVLRLKCKTVRKCSGHFLIFFFNQNLKIDYNERNSLERDFYAWRSSQSNQKKVS